MEMKLVIKQLVYVRDPLMWYEQKYKILRTEIKIWNENNKTSDRENVFLI